MIKYDGNKKLDYLIKLCVLAFIVLILGQAETSAGINPFLFGFAFALAVSMDRGYLVTPIFVLSGFLGDLSLTELIVHGSASIILLLVSFLPQFGKKKWGIILLCMMLVVSESANIYYSLISSTQAFLIIIEVLVAVCFCLSCLYVFKAIEKKGFGFKFSVDEYICIGLILIAISCGVSNINIFNFPLFHCVSILIILISAYCFSSSQSVIISILMGLGYAIATENIGYLALLPVLSLIGLSFKINNPLPLFISVFIIDITLNIFLSFTGEYGYLHIIATIIAGSIFLVLPQKTCNKIKYLSYNPQSSLSSKNLINSAKQDMFKNLLELSDVFSEMNIVFRKSIKGSLEEDDAIEMLNKELIDAVCNDCVEKASCHRQNSIKTNLMLKDLFKMGFKRGKVTLLDLPQSLSNSCHKTNIIISKINNLIAQYSSYASMISNLDNSRVLIADQLSGVSKIMRSLSNKVKEEVVFNQNLEFKIVEELKSANIVCDEANVYETNSDVLQVCLLLRGSDAENEKLEEIVSDVCLHKLETISVEPAPISGFSIVKLKTAPKYNVLFGYASASRAGQDISGDNYSLMRLNDNKFIMALCDGMGCGDKANKTSDLSLSLIENFYKAGFDNDIILSSVNKLLLLSNDENFSAIDISVIDLNKCFVDFIKLGSPMGYIKRTNQVIEIKSGALPMGILKEAQPVVSKFVLKSNDMIIMITDGIMDAFSRNENFMRLIQTIDTTNPQILADTILNKAVEYSHGLPEDDMTVIISKIFIA